MSRRALAAFFALAFAGALGISAASASAVQVTIFSKKLWAPTGIQVHAGDVVTITATGSWTWGGNGRVGPDGDPIDDYNAFDLYQPFDFFSQARVIAFIGRYPLQKRWGDGSFFPQQSGYFSIGSGQTIVAPYDGPLWVGMNDAAVTKSKADNKGQMLVTIVTGNPGTGGPAIAVTSPSGTYALNQNVTTQFTCTPPRPPSRNARERSRERAARRHVRVRPLRGDGARQGPPTAIIRTSTVGYVVADASSVAVTPTGGVFPPTYMGSRSLVQQFILTNPQSSPASITSITTQAPSSPATIAARRSMRTRPATSTSISSRTRSARIAASSTSPPTSASRRFRSGASARRCAGRRTRSPSPIRRSVPQARR